MTTNNIRAVIVGASSLLGKELADQLNASTSAVWDLTLLDTEESVGQVTAAGDEPLVIQALTPESFSGAHVVFFAADAENTKVHWRQAAAAAASIVDLTGALTGEPAVSTRAPLLAQCGVQEPRLDLSTEAVVAAHPVSLMLTCVGASLRKAALLRQALASTVLLPASEQGKAGIDELHAQTVALLSFQDPPREVFDAQAAFSTMAELGPEARFDWKALVRRVQAELRLFAGDTAAPPCALQLLQAPVFHGCTASVFLSANQEITTGLLREALSVPDLLTVTDDTDDMLTNLSIGEGSVVQVSLRKDAAASGYWLWMVVDNIALYARNAIACAGELMRLRPSGSRLQ